MNSVVFQTAADEPFAELVMALPIERERIGMFIRKPAEANGPEVEALRPGQPKQYLCDYRAHAGGTTVTFENEGWRIIARLDADDHGEWFADNGREQLHGRAQGIHFAPTTKPGLAARVGSAIRGLFS